jgi:hypothetical protein
MVSWCAEGRWLTHVGISGRPATAVSQAGVPGGIQTFRTRDAIRSGLSADWPVKTISQLFFSASLYIPSNCDTFGAMNSKKCKKTSPKRFV